MKKSIVILVIISFLLPLISFSQNLLINDSENDVTLTLKEGEVVYLNAMQSSKVPQCAPIAYLMILYNDDSNALIKRDGFVTINDTDTVFVSKLISLRSFLKNNSSEEIAVDYGQYTVFIPPGTTRELKGIVLNQDQSYSLIFRSFVDGKLGPSEIKEISFSYHNGQLLAEE